jgi:spermidine synthase
LQLMLGHAAYAQTLVLSIFMGGMALGAWLASRYSRRWAKPLLAYAWAEMAVGLMALVFHPLFTAVLDGLHQRWLPAIDSPLAADVLKWSAGALLILPQSVLLGSTFPLMSAGFIRLYPATPGAGLGLLYFANSLGAAVGVLVSVFVLIPKVGLPGTMMTAGLLNAALAIAVWTLTKGLDTPPEPETQSLAAKGGQALLRPLLAIALCSSLASFFYEIGWIRMLSMVLGSSVQAFELMLSAFILGLAFGGLWIRRRLDGIEHPLRYAGRVQLLMGVCALATLPLYLSTFDAMAFLLSGLSKSEGGWWLFNIGSQAVAMAVMLPATFTAGMTLPLFTYALLRQGEGERGIGRVYSANTVGAIVGVLLAVHWVMPAVGVKGLIGAGALLDMLVGLALLAMSRPRLWRFELPLAAASAGSLFLAAMVGIRFDPLVMASGVYRTGAPRMAEGSQALYYRDGKTASVALVKGNSTSIITNGKPDASIQMDNGQPSRDELTQILAAALPLSLHPQARDVAVIGFGSGMTSHVLLGARTLARLDTIEIERSMVEAARGFGPFVERAYKDPRSHIHIDDAKTYFSSHNSRYDVIVSEPSNPWVSGVANLFSDEFYQHALGHLRQDGILVQWLQLYETNVTLLSSVFQALSKHFKYYAVFSTINEDSIVVASNSRRLDKLDGWIFEEPDVRDSLARAGLKSLEDLRVRRIGGEALLRPWFAATGAPVNSDYFPYLSHNAPKARYLKQVASSLPELHHAPVPILEMLDVPRADADFAAMSANFSDYSKRDRPAGRIVESLLSARGAASQPPQGFEFHVEFLRRELSSGTDAPPTDRLVRQTLFELAAAINPSLPASRAVQAWDWVARQPGYLQLSGQTRDWLGLYRAVALRDGAAMGDSARKIIDQAKAGGYDKQEGEYLLLAALTGYLALGEPGKAREVIALSRQRLGPLPTNPSASLDLLLHQVAAKI